jgi:hypothetical protein
LQSRAKLIRWHVIDSDPGAMNRQALGHGIGKIEEILNSGRRRLGRHGEA